MTEVRLSIEEAQRLVIAALQQHNTSSENAKYVARALVAAEIDGQPGHGLSRVKAYAAQAASGKVDGYAKPIISVRKEALIRIDAANGFAFPALDLAISQLTSITQTTGMAAASIFRSHHFGQAGYHVEQLAERGLVGIIFGNSPRAIAPWNGKKGVFGTNPIALAVPKDNSETLLIDLSLGKVARGKIMLAKQNNTDIPEGWALDEQGQPTTNPEAALKGTVLPVGEAKGVALALMVEILAAALGGANFSFESSSFFDAEGKPPGVGQFLLAIEHDTLSGQTFTSRLEDLFAEILFQDGVRLPGSKRFVLRETARSHGICISRSLYDDLCVLAGKQEKLMTNV